MKRLVGKKYQQYIRHERYKKRKLLKSAKLKLITKFFPENISILNKKFQSIIEEIAESNNPLALDCKNVKNITPYDIALINQHLIGNDALLKRVLLPKDPATAKLFEFLNFNNGKALVETGTPLAPLDTNRNYESGTEFITAHPFILDCQKIEVSEINDIIGHIRTLEKKLKTRNKIFNQEEKIHLVRTTFHEVIANVKDHAYEQDAAEQPIEIYIGSDSQEKIWIMVLDSGKTIPITIKDKAKKGLSKSQRILSSVVGKVSDGKLIQAALKKSVSSLDKTEGRGRGLTKIIEKTKALGKASLTIYSNNGNYSFPDDKVFQLPFAFKGTLIYWEYNHQPA